MNKSQKIARRKQLHEQAELRKKRKQAEMEESMMEEEDMEEEEEAMMEEGEEDETSPKKKVQKEYTEEGLWMGPTSFEELEAVEAAQMQAHEINQVSWKVQDLVYNIIRHPMLDPAQKGQAIKKLGDGFEERVSEILSGEMLHKDLDVLSIEAILAHDARQTGLIEKAVDWINKKTLTSRARNKLPDSSFALPEKRKYPIHDAAHVRNALARAAQQIKAGGEGAADARAALPKIRAAAKKFGIETSMEKDANSITIQKDSEGNWRWVGWVSNNFIDRSQDIITAAAHEDFVEWVNKDIQARGPVFTSCHAPGTARANPVDFVAFENGFLVMSGKLEENEAVALMELSKECDIGMSHTGWGVRDPQDKRQVILYRSYEVTDLPVETADNPFTAFETYSKEADMNQLEYLTKLLGSEEKAKNALLVKTQLKQKELADQGIEQKEKPEDPPAAPDPQPINQQTLLDELVKAVGEKYGMDELNAYLTGLQDAAEKVEALESLVKALADNQDEVLAEKISPKGGAFIWMQKARASQDEGTRLDPEKPEDEKLKKSAPKLDPEADWLAIQTGVQPVRMQ